MSEHRWRLQFELRKPVLAEQAKKAGWAALISAEATSQAEQFIRDTFEQQGLPGRLEQALALGRDSWPLETIRRLGDLLLELREGGRTWPAHEVRWLNLCSCPEKSDDYTMRPRAARVGAGLRFASKVECETQ